MIDWSLFCSTNTMCAFHIRATSLVESEHPVAHTCPPGGHVSDTPESSMVFGSPFEHMLMSTITEWCVCTELAITELIVSTLRHIEVYWTASSDDPFALTITERTDLGMSTTAPLVNLSSMKIDVCGIDTLISWHTWWSVSTLLIWSVLLKVHHFLLREIRYILHGNLVSRSWRLHHHWCWCHYVSFMCLHLRTRSSNKEIKHKHEFSTKR